MPPARSVPLATRGIADKTLYVGPLASALNMLMKRGFFIIGFVLGVIILVAANIYSYQVVEEPCIDCSAPFGFPLPIGSFGGFVTATSIWWPGLIANTVISLVVGFVFGWVFTKLLPLLVNLFRQASQWHVRTRS